MPKDDFSPASREEVEEILRASDVASVDDIPADATVTEGYGEFLAELEPSRRDRPARRKA